MSKESRMKFEKFFDVLGEIIAFLAIVLFALLIINAKFDFLPDKVVEILSYCKEWVGLVLIAVVGMEATIKRNILIRIIFYLLVAVVVIFMFFPETYNYLINLVPSK